MHPQFFEPVVERRAVDRHLAAVEVVYPNGDRFPDYLMDISGERAQVFETESEAARAAEAYARRLYRHLGERRRLEAEQPDLFEGVER